MKGVNCNGVQGKKKKAQEPKEETLNIFDPTFSDFTRAHKIGVYGIQSSWVWGSKLICLQLFFQLKSSQNIRNFVES